MRSCKSDVDKRRIKALELLEKGVLSSDFKREINIDTDAMPKYLGRLRNRGIVIKKRRTEKADWYYTLETPIKVCFDLLALGDTKMSRQTAKKKAGPKPENDRSKFCHRETMWFILTR